MPVLRDAEIAAQNPWWTRPDWVATDPHLDALAAQPRRLPAPLVEQLDLRSPAIHVLRGPRQVGKSTALKLIVRRAIETDAYPTRRVLYLAFDLLEGEPPDEMADTVVRAERRAHGDGPSLILLDEVTVVPRWRAAVKYLWDRGELRNDVVVCTGSSATGLRTGAERLPGRRGAGTDHGMWPLTFAGFTRVIAPAIPPSPRLEIADLLTEAGRDTCLGMQVHLPELDGTLEKYLRFGGLPATVAEAVDGTGEPSAPTCAIVHDSLLKELADRGAGSATAHRLLERVVRSLGSKLSWTSFAQDLGTGHPALLLAPGLVGGRLELGQEALPRRSATPYRRTPRARDFPGPRGAGRERCGAVPPASLGAGGISGEGVRGSGAAARLGYSQRWRGRLRLRSASLGGGGRGEAPYSHRSPQRPRSHQGAALAGRWVIATKNGPEFS